MPVMLVIVPVLVVAACAAVNALRRHRRRAEQRRRDTWSIGVYEGPTPWELSPANGASNPVIAARDVSDLAARFVADPFVVDVEGRFHLFFEVMPKHGRTGVIAHATSDDLLRWTYDRVVLREPFHLSYPCVFAHDGAIYMVPECAKSGGVRLYRAEPFPHEWRHVATLIESRLRKPPLLNPSLVFHEGRWYLFTFARRPSALHLYSADTLTGPWSEHPRSPIVSGRDAARPGGRVVRHGEALYRFAQDGEPRYGSRVWAFRITALTATDYSDSRASDAPVVQAGPESWHQAGMHTVDALPRPDGRWVAMVDGLNDRGPASPGPQSP